MHWVSRVVKATGRGAERRADSQQSGTWQKTNHIHDVMKPTVFADVFRNDAEVVIGEGGITSSF